MIELYCTRGYWRSGHVLFGGHCSTWNNWLMCHPIQSQCMSLEKNDREIYAFVFIWKWMIADYTLVKITLTEYFLSWLLTGRRSGIVTEKYTNVHSNYHIFDISFMSLKFPQSRTLTFPLNSKSLIISGRQIGYTCFVNVASPSSSTRAISLSYCVLMLNIGCVMIRLMLKCCSRPLFFE